MCLWLFVECLAQVLIKGVEKDIFDGQRVRGFDGRDGGY